MWPQSQLSLLAVTFVTLGTADTYRRPTILYNKCAQRNARYAKVYHIYWYLINDFALTFASCWIRASNSNVKRDLVRLPRVAGNAIGEYMGPPHSLSCKMQDSVAFSSRSLAFDIPRLRTRWCISTVPRSNRQFSHHPTGSLIYYQVSLMRGKAHIF